ncbi:MAG: ABC transporter permease [Syntrophales bacterium]|nr:ABC transporter permease [Syntrophales bacterium]
MIGIGETVKISLRALRSNKMRSFLTMLGMIIGVGAVVAMLAIGQGASRKISEQIASMGSNMLLVLPGAQTSGGLRMGMGTQMTLTYDDALAIERECSAVSAVAPSVQGVVQLVYGNQNWSTVVYGTTPGIFEVRDLTMKSGRPLLDQDVRNSTKVCVLGQTVVDNLFGDTDPVGQIIRIKKVPFVVVGVVDERGPNAFGHDQDDVAYIPLTTAQKKILGTKFSGTVRSIGVKAKSADLLDKAEEQITELLKQRHRIGPRGEADFTVRNLTQLMQTAQESSRVMTLLLGAIASVSLLVGGIGIMNIMLVSVTERTREIGIRMAVGARTWDIRFQFLMEALTLALIGGIIGILVGWLTSIWIGRMAGWSIFVSPLAIVLAFSFSALVGIFFGFYPAYKASLMQPVDALRYE